MKCEIIRYPVPDDGGRQTYFRYVCKTHGLEITNTPGFLTAEQCPIGQINDIMDKFEQRMARLEQAVEKLDEPLEAKKT